MRRILLLTDLPPDRVLPAAISLDADLKTERPDADSLRRIPDLAPDAVLVDGTEDPERAFGLCSTLAAARGAAGTLVVLARDQLERFPWHRVADDFVYRDASPEELRLRLGMLRIRRGDAGEAVVRLGPLAINVETFAVEVAGRTLDLTYKEFQLLRHLAQRPGRVFTRVRLLQEVWGYDFYGGTRTVDVHVRRLRAKLGPEHEHLIETVRGVGYRAADA